MEVKKEVYLRLDAIRNGSIYQDCRFLNIYQSSLNAIRQGVSLNRRSSRMSKRYRAKGAAALVRASVPTAVEQRHSTLIATVRQIQAL